MKKYLFVVPSLSKGGAERVVSLLSSELVRTQNKDVTIITHFKTKNDYVVDDRVKIICLSNLYEEEYRKKINILYLVKLLFLLRRNINKENADYILPFLWSTCLRVDFSLFFSKHKKNVIQTVRNNPKEFPKNKIMSLYRNYLIAKYPKTIVQNEEQKKYFKSKLHKKIFILNNPINSDIFEIKKRINDDKIKIIGVGRLEKQKNFELLITSFYQISKMYDNVSLEIYGEGTQLSYLKNLIQEYNLKSKAFLMGRVDDYNVIYGSADIFVLSSNCEGMPNALLEAMGASIACISTKCPTGPEDIIDDGINGILIPIEDSNELINKLNYLINHDSIRDSMGKNARDKVLTKYSVNKITNDLIKICEK